MREDWKCQTRSKKCASVRPKSVLQHCLWCQTNLTLQALRCVLVLDRKYDSSSYPFIRIWPTIPPSRFAQRSKSDYSEKIRIWLLKKVPQISDCNKTALCCRHILWENYLFHNKRNGIASLGLKPAAHYNTFQCFKSCSHKCWYGWISSDIVVQADKRYTLSNIPPIFYIWPSRLVVRGEARWKFDYGKDRHVIWPKWDPNLITTKSRGGRGGSHVHVWYLCSQLSFTSFPKTGWDLQLKLSLVLGIPTEHKIGFLLILRVIYRLCGLPNTNIVE